MKLNKEKLSRKNFLQTIGSVVAGGAIAGVSGTLLFRNTNQGSSNAAQHGDAKNRKQMSTSPYKPISSFSTPQPVETFELFGSGLAVASLNTVYIYSLQGTLRNSFTTKNSIRDIVADSNNNIYLLFPARIEVYNENGSLIRSWDACSSEADYCAMAVTPDALFVTDAAAKNICKYTVDGSFVKFIHSPDGFIIPSYSFGIACANGAVYCSNPGRHRVEIYSTDGEYTGSFGQAGNAAGMFCGCCNPVHLTHTSTGEIITSEKGTPRISCYGSDGAFRSVLLGSDALGDGTHRASDVKTSGDKLFIAGRNMISTYRYDKTQAVQTACAGCTAGCPLRERISI